MENEKLYNAVNKLLKSKIFNYKGKFAYGTIEVDCDFKVQITKGFNVLHMGNPVHHIGVEVQILKLDPDIFVTLLNNLNTWNQIKDRLFYFSSALENEISEMFKFAGLDTPMITKIIPPRQEQNLTEGISQRRGITREIVKDIIKIFKEHGEGEYILPEDIDGEMVYLSSNLATEFTIELRIEKTDEIAGYELDGGYYEDDDTIEIEIIYNPKYFPQMFYELVGQLNETVRHELEHLIQAERGEEQPTKKVGKKKYYLQPHEIRAQLAGFKRLSKLRKEPIENTIRNWFYKNKAKHRLKDRQVKEVIDTLLSYINKS